MQKFILFYIFCSTVLMASCAKPVYYATPSQKPEVTINNKVGTAVKSEIIGIMINNGYALKNESLSMITFDKPIENPLAAGLFGSRYDLTPNARIVYNIFEVNNTTRIVASFMIVTNPNSGFEHITPANNNAGTKQYMLFLEGLKKKYDRKNN